MSSYAGADTAKQRQMDRIDARNRKSVGRGGHKRNDAIAVEDGAPKFIQHHLDGVFTQKEEIEKSIVTDGIHNLTLTSYQLKEWVFNGGVPSSFAKPSRDATPEQIAEHYKKITKSPLIVLIKDDPKMGAYAGAKIVVKSNGFFLLDESVSPPALKEPWTAIWSVNVQISGVFGYRFQWNEQKKTMFIN